MARARKPDSKQIEQYDHKDKKRCNNPPVGLVTPETDKDGGVKAYQYDPHLDPQLIWAGKAEHTSFEVPIVSLHVHERIDPKTIIKAVQRRSQSSRQISLFELSDENPPIRSAIDFYKHRHNWSNRLIAGDSLLVMNSLLEKEGMDGRVQMIYIDPPYGIRYGSNFQPFVNKRDVKDGKDEDLTQEPEQIRAFRDTWELGIHSYLAYLRDRLLLARELLSESGSVFAEEIEESKANGIRAEARKRELPQVKAVLGGASANLIDRALNGHVTDYLHTGWWPTFNVADTCIVLGALTFAIGYAARPAQADTTAT